MKDLFCFIVLLFYLTACSDSNRTLESELVNITDITYFEDESFSDVHVLHSAIFNDSVICNPICLGLGDSLLWVADAAYSSDTLVRCYSISGKNYLGAVYSKGNAPMELLSAASFDMSTDSLSYWTFDVTRQLWVGRPCFDLSLSTSTDDWNIINLRDSLLLGINNPHWLNDGRFVVNSLFCYKERFFICDPLNMSKQSVLNSSFQFKDRFSPSIMSDIFSTHLCVDDSRSYIVLAGKYLDLIEVYDTMGKSVLMLKGPKRGFSFKFDFNRSVSNSVLVKSPESRRAYLDIKAVQGKIYALYSGKSKDDKVHYSYSNCLYVFSMDGKCLSKYILDCPICDFVVDINKKRIYGISLNAEIVYFDF